MPEDCPLTPDLQMALLSRLEQGLKPRHVALALAVDPRTLRDWIEAGERRDAVEPYRGFAVRWAATEAQLMAVHVERWNLGLPGATQSREFLERRWPNIWGKDAAPDDVLAAAASTSNAEETAVMEEILDDPSKYGLLELFAKHGRLRADGT